MKQYGNVYTVFGINLKHFIHARNVIVVRVNAFDGHTDSLTLSQLLS